MSGKVTVNGQQVDFDAAVNLMDNEIREDVHSNTEWSGVHPDDREQAFVDAYAARHAEKFDGEQFQVA